MLSQQSFKDYEVILVDELHDLRKGIVSVKAKQLGVNAVHLAPEYTGDWSVPQHWNQAVRASKGDLIITLDDYTYAHSDWLQLHDKFWRDHTGVLGCGPTHDVAFPVSRWPLPLMRGKAIAIALEDEFWRESLWSVFMEPGLPITPVIRQDGGKPVHTFKPWVPPHWAYGNIAIPKEIVVALNGWDENYSGSHGFWDNDMAYRLAKAEYKVQYLPEAACYHMYHDGIFLYDHMGMKIEYFEKRKKEIAEGAIRAPKGLYP